MRALSLFGAEGRQNCSVELDKDHVLIGVIDVTLGACPFSHDRRSRRVRLSVMPKISAVVAAIVASACCVGPVALTSIGAGALVASGACVGHC